MKRQRGRCGICFERAIHQVKLKCDHSLCKNCLYNWTKSYMEDNVLADEISLPCPFEACRKLMAPEDFLPLLSRNQANSINECMLRHYLNHQKDIQKCPKPSCNYAGVSGYLPKFCYTYTCAKCGESWKDHSQTGMGSYLAKFTSGILSAKDEFLSNLRKRLTGNFCPNCAILISKDSGCPHMVCNKCKHEFCWICLDSFFQYKHTGINTCGLRWLYNLLLMAILITFMLVKLSVHFPIINSVFDFILWLSAMLTLGILEILSTVGVLIVSIILVRKNASKIPRKKLSTRLTVLGLAAVWSFCFSYNKILHYYSMLSNVWVFNKSFLMYAGAPLLAFALIICAIREISYEKIAKGICFLFGAVLSVMTFWALCGAVKLVCWIYKGIGFELVLIIFLQSFNEWHSAYSAAINRRIIKAFYIITVIYLITLAIHEFTSVLNHIIIFAVFMFGFYIVLNNFLPYSLRDKFDKYFQL
eukprot:TRINITY_DN5687_c0_g4_i5.p1 TRINITY_DN5687_c0_g4~~TRINITY_DN5687_c0_g4_i5.p1  ORF type:complete len:473 (-),score=50.60 TRINITY_DN5687_c0_g4_i5:125-1543(-)